MAAAGLTEPRCASERGLAMGGGRPAEHRFTVGGSGKSLAPLSEDGVTIDHVLGAANYRPLLENEELMAPLIRTKWL